MRILSKAMIGLLLGAAIATPFAAQAQEDGGRNRGNWRGGGDAAQSNNADRGGYTRREAVSQGREAQRAVERPAPPQTAAPVTRIDSGARDNAVRVDNRGDQRTWNRSDNRTDANAANRGDARAWDRSANSGDRNGDRNNVRTSDRRDDRNRDWDRSRNGDRNNGNWDRNNGNRSWSSDRNSWNDRDRGQWNRDWRNDRRYSWQDYRNHNRDVYRLPRYQGRSGYSYRRWYPGYRFDPWYYSSSYWIDDPFYYRLPPAYGDYRWVRYYNDAALVDIRTGMIVDIIYSVFF